jgi:uncharacterized sporulation protein YeaH/YhbH (DUF444 family)
MFQLIDRRLNAKHKSIVNRDRFLRRYRDQIKDAVTRSIKTRGVTDIDHGDQVSIPKRQLREPAFSHGHGGSTESVHPGNQDYLAGDEIDRPQGGQGGASKPSEDGEGEDDFSFALSRDEYLNFIFDDLELPNLVKEHLLEPRETRTVRVGFASDGMPANLHVVRSLKGAIGRRIALGGPLQKKLHELEARLELLRAAEPPVAEDVSALEEQISVLRARILGIPYLDPFDLRYVNRIKQPKPSNRAVMFCLMDVSGSMDESRKDMAKRFFILLYLFLTRSYDTIEVVFIRHHTQATEVDEEDFFNSRETGGTIVSSALHLMIDIIKARYPQEEWNIYGAQASDGDNWHDDSPACRDLLNEQIMPLVQYFAYIEITDGEPQNLWQEYQRVKVQQRFFAMQRISSQADIYPVFRELFKAQTGHD